jgi:hypothetical protein
LEGEREVEIRYAGYMVCTTWLSLFLHEPNKNCDQSITDCVDMQFFNGIQIKSNWKLIVFIVNTCSKQITWGKNIEVKTRKVMFQVEMDRVKVLTRSSHCTQSVMTYLFGSFGITSVMLYTPLRNPLHIRRLHGVYNLIEFISSWTEQKLWSINHRLCRYAK